MAKIFLYIPYSRMRVNSINPIFHTFRNVQREVKHENKASFERNITSLPNFYYSPLSFKGNQKTFKEELKEKFVRGDQEELFEFLDKSLRKRAQEKGINPEILDDVVQGKILDILLLIQDFEESDKSQDELYDKINEIYINLKPKKEDYVTDVKIARLDKETGKKEKPLIDSLTGDNEIKRPSSVNNKEREKQRKNVEGALSKADLTQREKDILGTRFSEDELVAYKSVGNKHDISYSRTWQILKSAIFKIQIANGTVPLNIKQFIDDFAKTFNLDNETVQDIIKRDCEVLDKTPKEARENVQNLINRFENEKLKEEDYIRCCIKYPQLFCLSPDTIEKNVRSLVDRFKDEGLTTEDYIKCCTKQPSLFYLSPDNIENNVRSLVDRFKDEGLTTEDYIKCCTKQSQLFYQLPETIEKNVRGLVDKFKDEGLTTDNYIKCCIKQPSLFYQLPETNEKHVRGLIERFEKEGLTTDNYIKCCTKSPSLFCQSPNTIEKNVRSLVDKFKDNGLTAEDYIKCCIKNPQLFCMSSDTISEHIDILRFCNLNLKEPLNNKDFWAERLKRPFDYSNSSSLLLIKKLIIPKMFENSKIPKELKGSRQRAKLNEYLKNHPDAKYVLNVKELDCDTNCIKILEETLSKIMLDAGVSEDTYTINLI